MRSHFVKIPGRVTMELSFRVQHNWRNPNGSRAQRFDVIELLFDAFEISAMYPCRVAGSIRAFRIIVVCVPVVKSVGDDLVDALCPPKIIGLGGRLYRNKPERS